MVDIFTTEKRSWIMSRVRSKNTKIDIKMKKILASLNCNYKMYPKMYGNPDFIIDKKKISIFCDGDFWHGYGYETRKKPVKKFWRDKIESNMRRDRKVSSFLRRNGWSVLRFWEHDIDNRPDACKRKILRKIRGKSY